MAVKALPGQSNGYDPNLVKSFVDRLERLDNDKAAISEDVLAVKKEAKAANIPVKALSLLLKERKQKEKLGTGAYQDLLDQVDALKLALGEFSNSPLGQAAIAQAGAAV